MKVTVGAVVGMNLTAACLLMQGCKAPKARTEAELNKTARIAPAAEIAPTPAPAVVDVAEPKIVEAKPVEVKPIVAAKPVAPAPVPAESVVIEAAPAEAAHTEYTIKKGDMLSKICARYGLKQSAVLKLNPGLAANKLYVGKKILLPGTIDVDAAAKSAVKPALAPKAAKSTKVEAANLTAPVKTKPGYKAYTGATKEYVVVGGDSLGKIAYQSGITVRALKDLNGLKKDFVRVGQKLKVPAEKQVREKGASKKVAPSAKVTAAPNKVVAAPEKPAAKPAEESAAKPAAEESKVVENVSAAPASITPPPAETPSVKIEPPAAPAANEPAAEVSPAPAAAPATVDYTVKEGEDLLGIAVRYGLPPSALRDLNNIADGEVLKAGRVIKIPADAKSAQ